LTGCRARTSGATSVGFLVVNGLNTVIVVVAVIITIVLWQVIMTTCEASTSQALATVRSMTRVVFNIETEQ